MSVIAQRGSSVHRICEHAKLPEKLEKVVSSTVQGIVQSGSVMLSEIVRTQVNVDPDNHEDTRRALHARVQALSCTMAKAKELDGLADGYLKSTASDIDKLPFFSFDVSDISKPHGRHFQDLAVVRDASAVQRTRFSVQAGKWAACIRRRNKASRRGHVRVRPGRTLHRCLSDVTVLDNFADTKQWVAHVVSATPIGRQVNVVCWTISSSPQQCICSHRKYASRPAIKQPGYSVVSIEAGDGKGTHMPLDYHMFSTQERVYQELGPDAWRLTLQSRLNRMLSYAGRNAIWTLDRAFDDIAWYNELHGKVHQSIIRAKGNRLVRLGTAEHPAQRIAHVARHLALPNAVRIPFVDKSTHEPRSYAARYNFVPIHIDGVKHRLWLFVLNTNRRNPMYLITDRMPASSEQAELWIRAYILRWKNEECSRVLKGVVGLENFRVRSLASIRRLLSIALIAVGLVASVALFRPRLARALLDRALEFIKHVQFKVYRLWRVLKTELNDKTSPPILYWRL